MVHFYTLDTTSIGIERVAVIAGENHCIANVMNCLFLISPCQMYVPHHKNTTSNLFKHLLDHQHSLHNRNQKVFKKNERFSL